MNIHPGLYGYTHHIDFEVYRPMLRMWVRDYFNTTRDAVKMHLAVLRIRARRGEVRDVHVHKLEEVHHATR